MSEYLEIFITPQNFSNHLYYLQRLSICFSKSNHLTGPAILSSSRNVIILSEVSRYVTFLVADAKARTAL